MVLACRKTEPGLIIDLKDWKIRGPTSDPRPRFWAPASAPFPLYPTDETFKPEKRLTEVFGGTPGSGFALAQGEAALSAQEAPHPCPACGGARSSQPPFTSCPEVGAAEGLPQTPRCCSSPGISSYERLPTPSPPPPAEQNRSRLSKKVTSVGFPGRPLSPVPVRQPELPNRGGEGWGRGCPSQVRRSSLCLTPKPCDRKLGHALLVLEQFFARKGTAEPHFSINTLPSLSLSVFIG